MALVVKAARTVSGHSEDGPSGLPGKPGRPPWLETRTTASPPCLVTRSRSCWGHRGRKTSTAECTGKPSHQQGGRRTITGEGPRSGGHTTKASR